MERAGLKQLVINPPLDKYKECIDEISRELIEKL
jgi:hypothetical protein